MWFISWLNYPTGVSTCHERLVCDVRSARLKFAGYVEIACLYCKREREREKENPGPMLAAQPPAPPLSPPSPPVASLAPLPVAQAPQVQDCPRQNATWQRMPWSSDVFRACLHLFALFFPRWLQEPTRETGCHAV